MKKILLMLIGTMLMLSFLSCSKKISFGISTTVPAARGFVKVKKDENKNYAIQVHIENLAEVKRLKDSKEAYVVWMIDAYNQTKNIGQISSSKSFVGGKLKAYFETVSVLKPQTIFITAEESATVQYPDSEVVLTASGF